MNAKNRKNILLSIICAIEAIIIIASVVFMIVINNSKNSEKPSSNETPEEPQTYMAFEDVITESNLIIEGVFIGQSDRDGYYELEFEVKNEYLGSYADSTIMIYAVADTEYIDNDTYYILEYDQYEEDETYLLFLQKIVSVYYDTERYVTVGEIVYPVDDPEAATMNGELLDHAAHQLVSQLSNTGVSSKLNLEFGNENDYIGVEYTDDSDLGNIAKYAGYVLKVKIDDYVYDNESLGTTAYSCEVLDSYSGADTCSIIIVNFYNDTVDSGEEYIVFLNKADEDSIVYALAAKENSVLEATESNINAVLYNISVSLLGGSNSPIPFADIEMYDWFYDSAAYVYGVGLMNGVSESLFSPEEYITREDVVVILGRLDELLNHESSIYPTPFTDVANPGTYYYNYIGWAYTSGIVNGISDTEFGVGLFLTRQDFCAMLCRYADFRETGMNVMGSVSFLDVLEISDYAMDAVSICANGGIINGYGDGTFGPQNNIRRAEVAEMITKYIQFYLN